MRRDTILELRRRSAPLLILLLATWLQAGCGGEAAVSPPDDVTLTEQGGTVTSADGKVTLVVPAGALTQPTVITIRPAPRSADPRLVPGTEYIFEPDGLRFAVPARLTIRYDSIPAAMADQAEYVWLHRRSGTSWTPMPGDPVNAATRTIAGEISGFSNYGGVVSQLAADLLTAALQLNAFLNDQIAENAIVLLHTIAALLQQQQDPAFQALAQPFLDGAASTACNAYANAINTARSAPVDDYAVMTGLLEPVYAWASVVQLLGVADGCSNATLTVDQIQTLKFQQFVSFYLAQLDPSALGQSFDRLVQEAQFVLNLRAEVQLLGLTVADGRLQDEAQYPLMRELRVAAYNACRDEGKHEYLGRLRLALAVADYTDEALLDDLQYCATRLTWSVVAEDQSVDESGQFGGGATPGSHVIDAASAGIAKGTIELTGDFQAFQCPGGTFESDELIVTLAGTEVHRRSAAGGSFLSSPLRLDAETILSAAGIDPDATATHPLVASRASAGCGRYVSLVGAIPLVTLRLSYPPPFLYENDFETAAGSEWSAQSTTLSPTGERFLGTFGQGAVTLSLANLPPHATAKIEFDFYTIDDWEGSAPASVGGPDVMSFRVDGQTVLRTSFSSKPGFNQAYPGTYPSASNPPMTGALATGRLGYPNGSGHIGDVHYRLSFTVPHTAGSLQFTLLHESDGESWGIDNIRVTVQK